MNNSVVTCSDILQDVRSLLRQIQYKKRPIVYRIPTLVRATCNKDADWFDNVSKFGYPPKDVLIKNERFGRCNWPTEPIFYCSSESGVPIFEVKPSIGDYIVLSYWESKSNNKISFNGVALGVEAIIKSLDKNDSFTNLLRRDEIFKGSDNDGIKEVDRFVAEIFVEDASLTEKLYWLTSSITKSYLEYMTAPLSGQNLDGLLYPSVAGQLSGFNIVLSTEFVDNNLQPREARMYRVISHDTKIMEYKLKPIKRVKGCYPTGELVWEDINENIVDQIWTLSPQSPCVVIK